MKFFAVFLPLIGITMAQRPTYAGSSPKGTPELASRFRDPDEANSPVPLGNRIGEGPTEKIPTDALGDRDLVNRLNQWPREHRPFWLINAEHLEKHRHPEQNQGGRPINQQGNQNQFFTPDQFELANRNNFGGFENRDQFGGFAPDSIPAKPTPPRSSFLGPLH